MGKKNIVNLLSEIHEKQRETFQHYNDFLGKSKKILPYGRKGLYWIWTNLSFEELLDAKTTPNNREVPIPTLVEQRIGLKYICGEKKGDFTIVYNGIGGFIKSIEEESNSNGLRKRILQEFNCSANQTGTLNIRNRFGEGFEKRWAVSFFDFDDKDNSKIYQKDKHKLGEYPQNAKSLELLWRLQYGTPILSRH